MNGSSVADGRRVKDQARFPGALPCTMNFLQKSRSCGRHISYCGSDKLIKYSNTPQPTCASHLFHTTLSPNRRNFKSYIISITNDFVVCYFFASKMYFDYLLSRSKRNRQSCIIAFLLERRVQFRVNNSWGFGIMSSRKASMRTQQCGKTTRQLFRTQIWRPVTLAPNFIGPPCVSRFKHWRRPWQSKGKHAHQPVP